MGRVTAKVDDRAVAEKVARELATFDHQVKKIRDELAADAELILAAHAPKGPTLRLVRGIRSRTIGDTVVIEARATDPESGYDYVGVTRFGHRVDRIFPGRVARSLSSPARFTKAGTVRKRAVGGAFALKTPWGPKHSVRGFKPLSDWAAGANEEVFLLGQLKLREMANEIERRLD